jgi:hypothetical protein
MQNVERTQGQVLHVGKLCIFVTPDGRLVTGMGNCRYTINQVEAKAMLDNLFTLASQFANHEVAASNGSVPALQ